MKPLIRTLLRMSAYQLFYMDRVPDSAAINEAVKLAKKRKFGSLSGFVNGVLRTISREKDGIWFPSQEIRFSIPEWILARWRREYGEETAGRIASSFLCSRPLSVRVNHSRASEEEVFESLRRQNISFRPGMAPDTLELADFDALWQVEAFQKDFLRCRIPVPLLWGGLPGSSRGISFWTFAARRRKSASRGGSGRPGGSQGSDGTENRSCGRKRGALRILQCPVPVSGRQSVGSVHGRTGGRGACGSSLFGSWDHGEKAGNPAAS